MSQHLRTTMERSIKAMTLRPAVGRHTAVSKARVTDGIACEIEEGRWKLVADFSEKGGGTGTGPDPGVLGRAALSACLAMGVKMFAVFHGVDVRGVEVEVQADFDVAAQYGLGDCPPGYTEVRYAITVDSDAPESDVMRVVEEAEHNSPWVDVYGRAQKLERSVVLRAPKE